MAFTNTEKKIVIAYNNKVTTTNVSNVTLASATADTSFPVANLKYEDPWRIFKTSATPSGNPVIKLQFAAQQSFTCFGLINHNIGTSAGYTVELARSTTDTDANYSVVGTTAALSTDANLLLRFAAVASTWWRITLAANPRATFYLGSVFLGSYLQLADNPADGGVNASLGVPIDFIESAGQAKHVRFGATKYTTHAELVWERATQDTIFKLVETIGRTNQRKVIGVITPEQVNVQIPLFAEHLFAYLRRATISSREGASSSTHRGDVILELDGVM